MSLVQVFVDAFKKAAGKKPSRPEVDMKTHGPLGSTTGGEAFDPLRPAPPSDTGPEVDRGDVSAAEGPGIASGDPEEGGEASRH